MNTERKDSSAEIKFWLISLSSTLKTLLLIVLTMVVVPEHIKLLSLFGEDLPTIVQLFRNYYPIILLILIPPSYLWFKYSVSIKKTAVQKKLSKHFVDLMIVNLAIFIYSYFTFFVPFFSCWHIAD